MNSNTKAPQVSVVILNWNGKKFLDGCLSSLTKQTYANLEIILVDNASSDGSVDGIADRFNNIVLIKNSANLGFGGGNNVGIKAANGQYVMVLNNDTELDPKCIAELVKVIERDPTVGACATKILSYYDHNVIDVAGIIIYPDGSARGRGRLEKASDNYTKEEEIFFGSDCAVLYRKKMLDEIGLYDADFFAHHDETDLGMRAHWRGWRCIYVPTAVVYHMYSASFGAYSPLKAFLVERNRAFVAIKNFPLPMLLISPFFTVKRLLLQAYGVISKKGASGKFTEKSPKFQLILIFIKAYASVLLNLPLYLKKRKEIMKNRKIKNSEFYDLFRRYSISASELALKD